MDKQANGTFYAAVVIDSDGIETTLYSGKVKNSMNTIFTKMNAVYQGFVAKGKPATIWSFGPSDGEYAVERAVVRVEKREYLPGDTTSVDRHFKGLRGNYTVLETSTY